jgi:predicted Rdx family selenoprotein
MAAHRKVGHCMTMALLQLVWMTLSTLEIFGTNLPTAAATERAHDVFYIRRDIFVFVWNAVFVGGPVYTEKNAG